MTKTITGLLLVAFTSLPSFAADPTQTTVDSKKQEMMKKFMEYSTPGASHKALEPMTGDWKYTSKMWESAKAKPEEAGGTSSMKMILGGRFLQQEIKGNAMGQPFEGIGFIGYDNIKGKYETLWLDNFATGVIHGTGNFDTKAKTLKDKGEFSCPMSGAKTRSYHSEWKIVDKNNLSYTMWGPDVDGKEFKQMEIDYKRVR